MTAPALQSIIRGRLVLYMLIPGLTLILSVGAYITYMQLTQLEERNALLAKALARHAESYVLDAQHTLKHLSSTMSLDEPAVVQSYIESLYNSYPHFNRLLVLTNTLDVHTVHPPDLRTVDFPPIVPHQAGEGNTLLLSRPVYSPATKAQTIYVGQQAGNGYNILAELDLSALRSYIERYSLRTKHMQVIVTDNYGNVIAHPDQTLVRQQANIAQSPPFDTHGDGAYEFFLLPYDGQYRLMTLVHVPTLDWHLLLTIPLQNVLAPVLITMAGLVLAQFCMLFIVFVLLHRQLRSRIVNPLVAFAGAIKHAAKRPGTPVMEKSKHRFAELDLIQDEFVDMASEIAIRQNELIQSKRHIQEIINSSPSAMIGLDAETQVTFWNTGAQKLTGLSHENAMHMKVHTVFPLLESVHEQIATALKSGQSLRLEKLKGHDQSDTSKVFDVILYPLHSAQAYGAVLRVDDITAKARLEDIMVQTEKMMSVGGLAAGMAHEINNPLGGIMQGAQNIKRRISKDLPVNQNAADKIGVSLDLVRQYMEDRKIVAMLEGILESGSRAAGIVSDMLNFSRQNVPCHTPCDIRQLIEATIRLASQDYNLKKKFDFKHVIINKVFPDQMPNIPCTATEVEQVIFNLLKNAAQAMSGHDGKNGTPTITITVTTDAEHASVTVSDNGPGIEEEVRKRIFEPFFTTKAQGIGTGLGLSVSYFIITNNHGGEFHVEEAPGGGAAFTFKIPLHPPDEHNQICMG